MQSPTECNQTHIPELVTALFEQLCSWKFLLSLTSPIVWIGYNLHSSPASDFWAPAGTQGTFIFCQTFMPLMQQLYLLPGTWRYERPQNSQGSSCGCKNLASASTAVTFPLSLFNSAAQCSRHRVTLVGKSCVVAFLRSAFQGSCSKLLLKFFLLFLNFLSL